MAGCEGRKVYGTRRWQRVRRYVLDRDGWRCVRCERAGRLEVHHKTRIEIDASRAFDPGNLESLCADCHRGEHAKPARADWDRLIARLKDEMPSQLSTV